MEQARIVAVKSIQEFSADDIEAILYSCEHPWKSFSEGNYFWLHDCYDDNFHSTILHLVCQT